MEMHDSECLAVEVDKEGQGSISLSHRMIAGQFPNYKAVVPSGPMAAVKQAPRTRGYVLPRPHPKVELVGCSQRCNDEHEGISEWPPIMPRPCADYPNALVLSGGLKVVYYEHLHRVFGRF
jgi:hypothetical protein